MASAFPRRLFEIMETEPPSVISWNADGKSFRINDTNIFSNDVLPRYFRHNKLTSFQRQLNLYGFQRVHVGPLGGSYHHPLFQRGNFALLMHMKRALKRGSSNEDDMNDASSSGSSPATTPRAGLGTTLLSSISTLPTDGNDAARRASDVVSAAAAAMSELVTPFPQSNSMRTENQEFSYEVPNNINPNDNFLKPKVSTSSMDSQEWFRAAELHTQDSLREEVDDGELVTADSLRRLARHNSSESEEHESLMEFDINQLEDIHQNNQSVGRPLSSAGSSGLDILANVSELDGRKQSWRHICGQQTTGIVPKSWLADDIATPAMLEKMVLDAHREKEGGDHSAQQYSELADSLMVSIGSKDALNLALALLSRTSQASLDDKLESLSIDGHNG